MQTPPNRKMTESSELMIVTLVAGSLSALCGVVMMYLHIRVEARGHLSSFVVLQAIGQILSQAHWVSGFPPLKSAIPDLGCRVIAAVTVYSFKLMSGYTLGLALWIFQNQRHLRVPGYWQHWWHAGVHTVALAFTVWAVAAPQSGEEFYCFPRNLAWRGVMAFFGCCCYWIGLGLTLYSTAASREIAYHRRIVFAYAAFLTPLILRDMIGSFGLVMPFLLEAVLSTQVSYALASSVGCGVLVARLWDKRLLVQLWRQNQSSRNYIELSRAFSETDRDASFVGYSRVFKSIMVTKVSNVLETLKRICQSNQEQAAWSFALHDSTRVYARAYFSAETREILRLDGLQRADLVESLDPASNMAGLEARSVNPGGSSEGFLFFTYDRQLILKSITFTELRVLQRVFPEYVQQVQRGSYLSRIFGVFEIQLGPISTFCVIYQNIISSTTQPCVFDLKGSYVARRVIKSPISTVSELPKDIVMKDEDFRATIGQIVLKPSVRQRVLNTIANDIKMLEQQGIMDYSLLLAIQDWDLDIDSVLSRKYKFSGLVQGQLHVVYIAIIDYLQEFTLKKRAELSFKAIKHNPELLSAMPPTPYMTRFFANVSQILASAFTVNAVVCRRASFSISSRSFKEGATSPGSDQARFNDSV